jgi:hypothetical protein
MELLPILGYVRTIEDIPGTDTIDYQIVFNVKAKYSKALLVYSNELIKSTVA